MALTKERKTQMLEMLESKMKEAKSSVFANFQGLSVSDFDALRADLRANGVDFKVVKKTLIRLAAKNAGYAEIPDEALEGSVGVALSMEDEVLAAKMLHKFAKTNKNLQLRGALLEGKVLSVKETNELALIPGKEELLAKFVYMLKSPIQGFHGVLNNTLAGFVRVLNAVKEKQEQGS